MALSGQPSNFAHLRVHDEQLVRLGQLAERYFVEDPNTCLLKLRQLTELLAQLVASNVGLFTTPEEKQADLLRRLQDRGIVPREVGNLFHEVRRAGNDANHKLAGDHRSGLLGLRLTWQLGVWFHRTFKDPAFKSGPFQPPSSPAGEGAELKAELDNLRAELAQYRATHQDKSQALDQVHAQVKQAEDERAFWESMAAEAETAKAELLQRLKALQAKAETAPPQAIAKFVAAANSAAAAIQISESDTRKLIDEQLAAAGWTVNSAELTFAKGARPQRGQHLAIAEWPTETGPADYALFVGLTPIAIVEAKRKHIDVSAALQQAKRYSRGFRPSPEVELPATNYGAQAEFRIPFVFSSNGRPYPWLAFSWENFRLSSQRSNQINRDDETDASVGKGAWFPLMAGSQRATWHDRCIDAERPVLLDPTKLDDVRLVEVTATGKLGASRLCLGDYERTRVAESVRLLGLDLPGLVSARQRTMRLVQELVDQVQNVLVAADSGAEASAVLATKLPIGGRLNQLQRLTEPSQPYAAAVRAQLRFLGYGELCAPTEQMGGAA